MIYRFKSKAACPLISAGPGGDKLLRLAVAALKRFDCVGHPAGPTRES